MAANDQWWEVKLNIPCHVDQLAGSKSTRLTVPKAVMRRLVEQRAGQVLRMEFRVTSKPDGFAQTVVSDRAERYNDVAEVPWA